MEVDEENEEVEEAVIVNMEIYTDGSAIQNEKAGIGIMFCTPEYPRISRDVTEEGKTSSFAELKAIQVALQTVRD